MQDTNLSLFARALGQSWQDIHPTVQRHYDLRKGEAIYLKGEMTEVYHSTWVKPFILVGRLFGALVPYRGRNVPTEVHNFCTDNAHRLQFRRHFFFPGRRPYPFNSYMEHLGGNEIVETVRFGLGIRMLLSVENGALVYRTNGYLWRTSFLNITLPNWLFFGSGKITESGLNEDQIEMDFTMIHPLFGKTFRYAGQFRLIDREDNLCTGS